MFISVDLLMLECLIVIVLCFVSCGVSLLNGKVCCELWIIGMLRFVKFVRKFVGLCRLVFVMISSGEILVL